MRAFLQRLWITIKSISLTVMVFTLLAGAGYAFLVAGNRQEATVQQNKLDRVRLDIDRLERENRRLKLLIMNLRESDELVEKIAREDAGLIKEGEIQYLFPY